MVSTELRQRVITAAVIVAVFLVIDVVAVYSSFGRILLGLVALAASVLSGFEVATFTFKSKSDLRAIAAIVLGVAPALFFLLQLGCHAMTGDGCGAGSVAASIGSGIAVLFLFLSLLGRHSLSSSEQSILSVSLGFLLISVGGTTLCGVALLPNGGLVAAWLVLVVAFNDIGAYFVGQAIRGPKLAPGISPGKTISGGIGGATCGILIGIAARSLVFGSGGWILPLLVGFAVSVTAQCGDLMKSILKRTWGVKDSGTLLPGHGGVLDRVDGLLGGSIVLFAALQGGLFPF